MEIKIWVFVLSLVGTLIVGGVVGFILARMWFKRYLEKNPPVTEKMVREMMRQMGRTPSERQVREVMSTMTPATAKPDKKKTNKTTKKPKK